MRVGWVWNVLRGLEMARKEIIEVYGRDVVPAVGRVVRPENWALCERLLPGDDFSPFRIPTSSGGPIKSLAVRVETTGRMLHRKAGDLWIKVKITFVGDGEPDQVSPGWMLVPW